MNIAVLGWDTAKSIDKELIALRLSGRVLSGLRRLGIDMVAMAKRHRYLTVVTDLLERKVVWVGEGRRDEAHLLKEEFREFYRLDFKWHWRRGLWDMIVKKALNYLRGWIRRAYGYRDREYFILKIYQACGRI